MRAIWTGSISFSLITIPISLFPATRREELRFRLLRASDLSPVNYKRVAEVDGKEVPWDQIVKGYEYEPGKFVVLKDEDFKRVDVEATQTIDIIDFVELHEIDPMFFDTPYYLAPQKAGVKAYVLLREALKKTGCVGIAKVVIKTRQHLAAVKPQKNALVLELMHFADELVKSDNLNIPANVDVSGKESEMGVDLVKRMTDSWDADKYTDDYRSALLELIQKKVAHGGETPAGAGPKKKRPSNVVDLVSVLQESLARTGGTAARKRGKSKVQKHRPKVAA